MAYHRVELGDSILKRLMHRIDSMNMQVKLMSNFEVGLNKVIDKQDKIILQNDKSFNQLDEKFNKLYAIVNRPKKWYERKGVLILFGAASVYAIKKL